MILTYKIKHNKDFSKELEQARKIAIFAINNRSSLSSKNVKHIGLKSAISNQILKKYGRNKKTKTIKSVKLTIPNQSIKVDREHSLITMPCLNLELKYYHNDSFVKINQIEISKEYAFISCEYVDKEVKQYNNCLGVDLNATGHCAVVSIPFTGKTFKLGKKAQHVHTKYKNIRKTLQKQGKYKKVKQIKNRESRIVKDLNHKISRKIVNLAIENKCSIKLEHLKGIRDNKKHTKKFNYALNSWSFYQLKQFIEYKAKKQGLQVIYIEPAYTSKTCSKCGLIGNRNKKIFKCNNESCLYVEHADVNAGFNIANSSSIVQLQVERDTCKGNTGNPKEAIKQVA